MKFRESRHLTAKLCELRAADDSDAPVIEGYAARFDVLSEDLGFGREVIKPGAFKRSLNNSGNEVVALWQHLDEYPLARRSAGNLDLEEDDIGLRVQIRPDKTSYALDLAASIRGGTVKHMSFGFRTIEDAWRTEDGEAVRDLIEAQLFDVSPVTTPAYPQTDVAVRSLLAHEGAGEADFARYSEELDAIRRQSLTTAEYRGIVDKAVRELRERRDGPGPESHPSKAAQHSRRSQFDRLERIGSIGQ